MYTGEVDCTYFFTWDTKYACVEEKEGLLCSVADGKKRHDLSALARHSGASLGRGMCVGVLVSARQEGGSRASNLGMHWEMLFDFL